MAPPFRFNEWYPVFKGPSTGRLIIATFGESDEGEEYVPSVLTFTLGDGVELPQLEVGIWYESIGDQPSYGDMGARVYRITGHLHSIDGVQIILPRPVLPVAVERYIPSKRDKGYASLKVVDTVGYDPVDLIDPLRGGDPSIPLASWTAHKL